MNEIHTPDPADGHAGIQDIIDNTDSRTIELKPSSVYTGNGITLRDGTVIYSPASTETNDETHAEIRLNGDADNDVLTTADPANRSAGRVRLENLVVNGTRWRNNSGWGMYGAFYDSRFYNIEFHKCASGGAWLAGSDGGTDDNVVRDCRFTQSSGTGLRIGAGKTHGSSTGIQRIRDIWCGNLEGYALRARGNEVYISGVKTFSAGPVFLDRVNRSRLSNSSIGATHGDGLIIQAGIGVTTIDNTVRDVDIWAGFDDGLVVNPEDTSIDGLTLSNITIDARSGGEDGLVIREGEYRSCHLDGVTYRGNFSGEKEVVNASGGWERTVTDMMGSNGDGSGEKEFEPPKPPEEQTTIHTLGIHDNPAQTRNDYRLVVTEGPINDVTAYGATLTNPRKSKNRLGQPRVDDHVWGGTDAWKFPGSVERLAFDDPSRIEIQMDSNGWKPASEFGWAYELTPGEKEQLDKW